MDLQCRSVRSAQGREGWTCNADQLNQHREEKDGLVNADQLDQYREEKDGLAMQIS